MKITVNERVKEIRIPEIGDVVRSKEGYLYMVAYNKNNSSFTYVSLGNGSIQSCNYDSLEKLFNDNPTDEIVDCELIINLR